MRLLGLDKRIDGFIQWYRDAKLGLFIHWGLYSVPAFAVTEHDQVIDFLDPKTDWKSWFANNAYSEWYLHTLRIPGSKTAKLHATKYGNADYYNFASEFNRGISTSWNPEAWAKLFADSGIKYVVLTTKHHDGFTLFPSAIPNPHLPKGTPQVAVDVVGNLTSAVRGAGMEMGLYYSGGLDWSFDPRMTDKYWPILPPGPEYAQYADAHLCELIERYKPSILWNDISYPPSPPSDLDSIFAEYYRTVPHGVVNDRFFPLPRTGGLSNEESFLRKIGDIICPEYKSFPSALPRAWETCRGISHSFGYNAYETEKNQIGYPELIATLVDVSAKNGNLLLGIGPRADGSIPLLQRRRLRVLGEWLGINGAGVYGTRAWWDGGAEGWLVGRTKKEVRAVQKRVESGYDLYFTVLGDLEQGKVHLEGFPELVDLLRKQKQKATAALLVRGPSEVPLPFSLNADSISLDIPAGLENKVAVDVPIPRPGETTGVDAPEPDETEKKVLGWTIRFGLFAGTGSRL